MTREEAKELFRKDVDSYNCPRKVIHKLDQIYDSFESKVCSTCMEFDDPCSIALETFYEYRADTTNFGCSFWGAK